MSDIGSQCEQAADAKKQKRRLGGKGKEDESSHPSAAALAAGAVVQVKTCSYDAAHCILSSTTAFCDRLDTSRLTLKVY